MALQRKTQQVIHNPLGTALSNYRVSALEDTAGADLPEFIESTLLGVSRLQQGAGGLSYSKLFAVMTQSVITVRGVQLRYNMGERAARRYVQAARTVVLCLQSVHNAGLTRRFIERWGVPEDECA